MITIRKIAELAGVSRGTVDRALNGRGRVSPDVIARIDAIVAEYGYKPNKTARGLANRKKSFLLGVISSSLDNVFFKNVLRGMHTAEKEAAEFGVSLLYREVSRFSVSEQLRWLDELTERGIDGLVINPINDAAVVDKLHGLRRGGLPIITFNTDVEALDRLAYIGCDYVHNGRIAAGLVALTCNGRATVAAVIGASNILGHSLRLRGFREELAAYPGIALKTTVEMFDDEITSYCKVGELLAANPDIDAVYFAAGGKEGGIRAILESGRRESIRVITVDLDPVIVGHLKSGVVSATVCQQPYMQGYEAVLRMARHLALGEKPASALQFTRSEIVLKQTLDQWIEDW